MKKKFLSLILCLVLCLSVLTGCSLVERNDKNYYEAVVCTISYVDGTKDEITKRELLMGYNSYGYNYVQNYGQTTQKAIETTLGTIVDQHLTIKAVKDHYEKNGEELLLGSETTYLWDTTYDAIYGNLKSYFEDVVGTSTSDDEEKEEDANSSVYTPYQRTAYLEEVDVMSKGTSGEEIKIGTKYVIKKTATASTTRDTYKARTNANGEVYDFEKEYFKEVMYQKLISFTQGGTAGAKLWKSALNNYLKDVKSNYSYKKFADDKECLMFEMQRVYDIMKNNYLVEKYEDIYNFEAKQDANLSNVSVSDVLSYYSAKVRVDYTNYCLYGNKSSFESDILDNVGDVDYVLEGDNATNYFYVGYVKLAFDDEQTARYTELKDDAYLSPTQKAEEIEKVYAGVKATVRDEKTGEETGEKVDAQILLNQIREDIDSTIAYTGDESLDKEIGYDKAEAFRKYLYSYSDDDTLKGAERNTVFGVTTDGKVLANSTFSGNDDALDAIKALYNEGNAKVGDTTDLVRAEDGLYIFFYAGKIENLFMGIDANFDASQRENNILTLSSTRMNIFSEKTIFDSIYETLTADNFSVFENMNMQNLKSNYVVNGGIKYIENNLKDLY